jgi:hypothetical protein
MKFKTTNLLLVVCFVLSMIIPAMVIAQEKEEKAVKEQPKKEAGKRVHPREEYPPDQRPEENYLSRFKAIEVSEDLSKENLENIYILKVIVSNFKEQGWEKEYNEIYEAYKKALAKFYRRQVVYSRVELEKNKKQINDLFKKIVTVYKEQTETMLDECADKILNFELDERNKFDPNRNRTLFHNMMRLWIAYGQIDDADSSVIDNVNKSAIYHLRIAKGYAIQILEDLSPEGAKAEQYRVHKADNLNRILSPETAKSTSPGTQSSPATSK